MKIDSVDSTVIGSAHYVRVATDSGLVGYGQSGAWAYPGAVHAVIEAFTDYLVGQDPRRIEHHWHHLYRMGPFRGAVLTAAVSAIDIALWDIAGKRLHAPVYDLLGGPTRTKLRLHLLLRGGPIEDTVAHAQEAVAEGFTAVKFDPIPYNCQDLSLPTLIEQTVSRTAAVRDVVGPDVDIILELHRKLTALQAPPVMEALTVFRPLFIEDPLQIDSFSAQAGIASTHNGPVGIGERLHTIWEFNDILTLGGPQYVRPDLGTAGGISHVKKIAAVAESHSSTLVTHNCLGPILTAAAAHVDASIPNFAVQEYSPFDDELASSPGLHSHFRRDGGWLLLSEEPGLGVDVDWDNLPTVDFVGRALHHIPLGTDGSVSFAV
jgi:galactonate dehydratase